MAEKAQSYAPIALRLGTALVFLWFGFSQLLEAGNWTGWLPEYATDLALRLAISAETLVYFNGAFEVFFGLGLLLGLGTRISAIFLGIHMAHIISVVGYSEIGVRDFAIFVAAVSIALHGPDKFSFDRIFKRTDKLKAE